MGKGQEAFTSEVHPEQGEWTPVAAESSLDLLEKIAGESLGGLEPPNLRELSRASGGELEHRLVLSASAARRVFAAFELGRRTVRARFARRPSLRTPERVHRLLSGELEGCRRERFIALHLDSKHRLREQRLVSLGTLTTSLVHPREVFGPALTSSAAALIVVHNHPSGDPEPSSEDLEITRRLIEVGRLLGVPLLDHVIVGERGFVSLRERIEF